MGGVDWRAKIRDSVEYFYDVSGLSILELRKKIVSLGIHILLDWDGYSNNGVRYVFCCCCCCIFAYVNLCADIA